MSNRLSGYASGIFRWSGRLFHRGRVPYEPISITFPPLDVLRYRRELDLEGEGKRRGVEGLPARDNLIFDDVEQRIVTAIEAERDKAYEVYLNRLGAYGDRLRASQVDGTLHRAAVAGAEAKSAFQDAVIGGKDRLFEFQRVLSTRSRELKRFCMANGIDRPSNRPESRIFHVGVLAFLLLVEASLNGVFLARGLDLGLLGGVGQALAIATVNVGLGVIAGISCLREMNRKNTIRKLVGGVGFILYLAAAIGLNLAVAHYRDALGGSDPESAATSALQSFLNTPFHIDDINSAFLFIMGFFFSLIATIDGYRMDDPYPGFGRLMKRYKDEENDFRSAKEQEAEVLTRQKEDQLRRLDHATNEIAARRSQYHAVLQQRDGFKELFINHMNHLERAGGELVAFYRNANLGARTAPAPIHFSESWKMARPDIEGGADRQDAFASFPDTEAERVLGTLEQIRREILESYDHERASYAQIEQLVASE
jgi:hypothetical protein